MLALQKLLPLEVIDAQSSPTMTVRATCAMCGVRIGRCHAGAIACGDDDATAFVEPVGPPPGIRTQNQWIKSPFGWVCLVYCF